jgi:hypothetical protein
MLRNNICSDTTTTYSAKITAKLFDPQARMARILISANNISE